MYDCMIHPPKVSTQLPKGSQLDMLDKKLEQ